MRWLVVIVLFAAGCDRLFGLRDVRVSTDGTTSDGHRDAVVDSRSDSPDGHTGACNEDTLMCGNSPRAFTWNGGCYAECNDLVSWNTARDRCMAWGGDLAILDTSTEDMAVTTMMSNGGHWIGMIQSQNAPTAATGWSWTTGAPVNNARWYPGEPMDGIDQFENHEEDCAYAHYSGWGDFSCTVTALTLCER